MVALRSARDWRVPPLVFMNVRPEGGWTLKDQQLAEALTVFEDSLCTDCHHALPESADPDRDGRYEVSDETVCFACAARERYLKNSNEPEPGQKITVILGD